jgi:hypothetical protein
MKKKQAHTKLIFAALLACVAHAALASFSGSADDRKNKFSLKYLDKISRTYSLSSLRSATNFQFKGSQDLDLQKADNNNLEINSMMRLEKGNTTYVFPYKYKVKVPKFKTPTPPGSFR